MDLNLRDRVVLVTGSASGIGKEAARVFAQEGAIVLLNDINAEALMETKAELEQYGSKVETLCYDVADEESVKQMFKAVEKTFGYLDVLVNNAGIIIDKQIVDMTYAEWRKIFSVNIDAYFLCTREAAKIMKGERKPVILNAGSVATLWPAMGYGCYAITKAAVQNLTKVTCGELAGKGIRVMGYIPGMTNTPINTDVFKAEPERICAQIPLGRIAEPEEIGRVVAFLASDAASYMAGSMAIIDGGKLSVQNPGRYRQVK